MKKLINSLVLKASILHEFFKTLLKFKLWWAMPVVFILALMIILLVFAGHTGIAAFIYPFF